MFLFRRSRTKKESELDDSIEIVRLRTENAELTKAIAYLVDVLLREEVELTEFDKLALGNLLKSMLSKT